MTNPSNPRGHRKDIALRPYNTKELAALYGVCTKTFRRWIKPFKQELGPRMGSYYSIAQVKIIFARLLLPSVLNSDEEIRE